MKNFSKVIEQISNRHDTIRVFDDFLQMAVCALSMGRMEPEYMETIKRYDKDEVVLFSLALGALILDYEEKTNAEGDWDDILGEYFMSINSASSASRSGQFFTPVGVCRMMAEMTAFEQTTEEEISVNDCSCGSSRNLIAHSRLNPENRMRTFYVGQDLDSRCVKMSVINYWLFGMKGVVIHQNTLSMDIYGGYRIYLAETCFGVMPLSVDQCKSFLFSSEPQKEIQIPVAELLQSVPAIPEANSQLTLF